MSFSRSVARLVAGAAISTMLAGCTAVDPGMGEAVKYDMFAQTVNPDPVYPPDGLKAGSDGTHGQKATERYRKDTVKAIDRESTSKGGSSSGSGSGVK